MLTTASIVGCDVRGKRVLLTDFESRQVEGLLFWWRDPAMRDEYTLEFDVALSDVVLSEDGPYIVATIDRGDGRMSTRSVRLSFTADPDELIVYLDGIWLPKPGEYRVSAYNAVGESALSERALVH